MLIHETPIPGLKVIEFARIDDSRGYFARTFCSNEFRRHDLNATVVQANLSFNHHRGTVRGMHFQAPPMIEIKLVRCTRGAVRDIVVDLRPESPKFLEHFAIELAADSHTALYVPGRLAHGYQTLMDATEVTYQVGEFYTPSCERGLRFDDPRLGLPWAMAPTSISEKDRNWPLLNEACIASLRRELGS